MKKHNKGHLPRLVSATHKLNTPFIFALFFGLIAVAIGLSQIFALSSVVFLFSPTSQNANANDSKTFTITLNSNGQKVDGGSARITYDPAQLSFVAFSASTSPYLSFSNQASSSGSYSFDFQIYYGSQSSPSLGTITLKAKSLANTQSASIQFDASHTKAYSGFNPNARTYYPTAFGQAAVVINGTAPPAPPPNPTPTPTPTPSPAPHPTPTPTVTPAPSTTQTAPAQNTANPSSDTSSTAGSPIATDPSSASTADNTNLAVSTKPTHKSSNGPLLIIGGGILLIGSAALLFFKYKHAKPPKRASSGNLHASILDNPNTAKAVAEKENIVVKPDTNPSKGETAQKIATPHEYPAILTKHAPPHHESSKETSNKQVAEQSKDNSPEPSKEKPATEETITTVKETTDQAHHKEVEVDIKHLKPAEAVAEAALTELAAPKPKLTDQTEQPPVAHQSLPEETSPPSHTRDHNAIPPIGAPVQPAPLISPPHNISSPHPASQSPTLKSPPSIPSLPVPEWQKHLTPQSDKAPVDNPPDMFELAAEHPETFGSYQVLEAEESEKDNPKKDAK